MEEQRQAGGALVRHRGEGPAHKQTSEKTARWVDCLLGFGLSVHLLV